MNGKLVEELAADYAALNEAAINLRAENARLRDQLKLAKVENNHNWQFQPIHEETLKENAALRAVLTEIRDLEQTWPMWGHRCLWEETRSVARAALARVDTPRG